MLNAKKGESPSLLRQRWLEEGVKELRRLFAKHDKDVPETVRVSIGWPHGTRGKGSDAIGQCWDHIASSDKHYEIFIAPSLKDGARILDVLAHELVHVIAGHKAGHKGAFKELALAIGLEGKMTATTAGPEFAAWATAFVAKHGDYPAGNLNALKSGKKKQGTRLLKASCDTCGYIVRVTGKWVEEAGAPRCGVKAHGPMTVDGAEEGEEE